jgi:hypothetical protein
MAGAHFVSTLEPSSGVDTQVTQRDSTSPTKQTLRKLYKPTDTNQDGLDARHAPSQFKNPTRYEIDNKQLKSSRSWTSGLTNGQRLILFKYYFHSLID